MKMMLDYRCGQKWFGWRTNITTQSCYSAFAIAHQTIFPNFPERRADQLINETEGSGTSEAVQIGAVDPDGQYVVRALQGQCSRLAANPAFEFRNGHAGFCADANDMKLTAPSGGDDFFRAKAGCG